MAIFITVGEYNNNAGNGEMQPSIKLPSTPPTAPVSPVVNPDGSVTYGGGGGKYLHTTYMYSEQGGANNCYIRIVSVNGRKEPYTFNSVTMDRDFDGLNKDTFVSINGVQTAYGEPKGIVFDYSFNTKKIRYAPFTGANAFLDVENNFLDSTYISGFTDTVIAL